MSKESIARWNAIPMVPGESLKVFFCRAHPSCCFSVISLQRPRSELEEDDSDGNVSIVSRSPSPSSTGPAQDDPYKYDEYLAKAAEEVITVETRIKPSNKGFAMLAKLGWTEGQPLGLSEDGRVDPVPFQIKRDLTGLGKFNQDVQMIETTVSQRRGLDSERMIKETEEQRRAREVYHHMRALDYPLIMSQDSVVRQSTLDHQLTSVIKAFYCDLCEKQFKTVVAYTEHTNSYAHHHKARFKEMQTNARGTGLETDKRKEKERKREEKELRKIAAASGMKIPKTTGAPTVAAPDANAMEVDGVALPVPPAPISKPGWAAVSGVASGFKPIAAQPDGSSSAGIPNVGSVPEPCEPVAPPPTAALATPAEPTGKAHAARQGWQNFQKKRR
ncbi:unnamed protein product [Mycena citricolor]|uniref:G-patch domain-containing protein n=1 Tax=Mycena citricolor TaxID=2018698 RepID=A0AAD2HSF0_9AGAR|nr:unnamed protein product [Mycena citricolor]